MPDKMNHPPAPLPAEGGDGGSAAVAASVSHAAGSGRPVAGDDFTACPHWGRGGRYVVDADGRRVPALPEADGSGTVRESPGTGQTNTPVAGDTLAAPGPYVQTRPVKPAKKGK